MSLFKKKLRYAEPPVHDRSLFRAYLLDAEALFHYSDGRG